MILNPRVKGMGIVLKILNGPGMIILASLWTQPIDKPSYDPSFLLDLQTIHYDPSIYLDLVH